MATRWLAAFLCALLAGCSSQANVRAGTWLAVGILAAASYGEDRERHGFGVFPAASAPAPPLDDSRRVNQQDCTRPIEDRAANLRCR